jgi:hypothetical protein
MATARKKKETQPASAEQPQTAQVAKPAQAVQAEPRMFNPFASAPKVAPVSTPAKKGAKAREEVEIDGMDKLAAFKVLEKTLENEAGLIEQAVRDEVIEEYVSSMVETGKKPDSFVGIGDISSASCEIRRRGSNMPISPETAQALTERGIPVDKKVRVPERLVLNPEMSQEHLIRLAELVKKDPVLSKETVVMAQAEEFSYVTSESTLDMLAKTKDAGLIRQFLSQLATFAVGKFKIEGVEIESSEKNAEGEKIKSVTPAAKAKAIEILKKMGIF